MLCDAVNMILSTMPCTSFTQFPRVLRCQAELRAWDLYLAFKLQMNNDLLAFWQYRGLSTSCKKMAGHSL